MGGRAAALFAVAVLAGGCARLGAPAAAPAPLDETFLGRSIAHAQDRGEVDSGRPLALLLMLRRGPEDPLPDAARIEAARAWLSGRGLSAGWTPGDAWLDVRGPAAEVEATFKVRVHEYRSPTDGAFYAARTLPAIPLALAGAVALAMPVSSLPLAHLARIGAVPAGGLSPQQLARAYAVDALREQGQVDGSGQTVVFWELGDGYAKADLDAFAAKFNLPPFNIVRRGSGANPTPEGELVMDLEIVHAIAPAARLVVYTDPYPKSDAEFLKLESTLLSENPGAIFSYSWGGCEMADIPAAVSVRKEQAAIYDRAVAAGSAIFASTGDSAAYDCMTRAWGEPPSAKFLGVEAPSSFPGVTAVGGTRISVRSDGTYLDEQVWEWVGASGGTGGGISGVFSRPSWQVGPGVQNSFNRDHRSIPDISADAAPESGMSMISNGRPSTAGGTSAAAPFMAALAALIDQYLTRRGLKPVAGWNQALYALAAGHPPFPPYHPVLVGSNLFYPAAPGYSLATGLGTPDAWNLARDLEAYQRAGGRI